MKVLQLGKHYPFNYGGIERFYFDLAKELTTQGVECDIFCANESKNNKIFMEENIKIITYGRFAFKASTSLSYKIFLQLKAIINDYDILHVHAPDPMITIALSILKPKVPIIIHWHSDIVKQKNLKKMFLPFQNWLLNNAKLIIATSPNYIESSSDLSKYKYKCKAIPSGLNPKRLLLDNEIYNNLKTQYKNKKIIYSFGRMSDYKGFEYLIESSKYLSDEFIVLIAGGGNRSKYENIIKELKLSEKVKLLGRIDDREVGAYYNLADIFVLPSISRNEAFGLVQAEAMYFAKPIVSTNIEGSGVSYVNQDMSTGLIIPIKNPKAIADACIKVLNDKKLYDSFSVNARKRFDKYFDIKSITQEIIKKYKEVLNDNKK